MFFHVVMNYVSSLIYIIDYIYIVETNMMITASDILIAVVTLIID